MINPKDSIIEYWVKATNQLIGKLQLETIKPEDLVNLTVQNTEGILTITVVCTSKILVLTLNDSTKKLTGGWKYF